jgi:hypothetical protein
MNQFIHFFLIICCLLQTTFVSASATSAQLPIVTRSSRNNLSTELLQEAKNAKMSILRPLPADIATLYQNYPDGSVFFPNNSDLATKFNIMIDAIKKNPNVIEFFRKIQINVLNQIYEHLMKIYINFNLTNPGCNQQTTEPTADVTAYLNDEATYATNKKKLIINHFVNLIQAQFGASIISYVAKTPPDMAVSFGKIFISNDQGIDLKSFAQPQTDPKIIADQATYIDFLKKYIDFFKAYTAYFTKNDALGVNQYFVIAKNIAQLPATKTLKPSMFFYDVETLRSIQFIPFVASTIPEKSQLIPWAPAIVNAAVKNLSQDGHPIAYFKDLAGNKTQDQQQARSLFLLVQTGPSLFEEELLAQPSWLNTNYGSIRVLRGCLGDVSALIGMGIIDETLEKIIQKATNPTDIKSAIKKK